MLEIFDDRHGQGATLITNEFPVSQPLYLLGILTQVGVAPSFTPSSKAADATVLTLRNTSPIFSIDHPQ
jgi:hypothetical protein